jgi:hypothetical protein
MTQAAGPDGRGIYHDDFRLSITKALGDQLAAALEKLGRAPLDEEHLKALDERPGVYQLYLKKKFVYVGKADKTLPGRLRNHLDKLSGRRDIDLADVAFSCMYVDEDFSALAPEQLLISHHKEKGDIPWNNNGFGNRDPGRQRDHTIPSQFDVQYKINIDLPVKGLVPGGTTLHTFLKALKSGLHYTFRYAEPPQSKLTRFSVPSGGLTADEAFRLISEHLPKEWQVTALLGYVIMYPDAPSEYKSAIRYYRSGEAIPTVPEPSSEEMTSDVPDADE